MSATLSVFDLMLRLASLLVPRAARQDWLTEWTSELWYLRNPEKGADPNLSHVAHHPALFCLGAFQDAFWMQRNCPDRVPHRVVWLGSPRRCLSALALLAAASLLAALRLPGVRNGFVLLPESKGCVAGPNTASGHDRTSSSRQVRLPSQRGDVDSFECSPAARPIPILPNLMLIVVAFIVLPVATSLGLGEYSAVNTSGNIRRYLFLVAKFAFVIPAVFLGGLVLGSIFGDKGIQPQAMLIGYVFAFRWVVRDQRQRCPVCLRSLTHPTRIGWISSTFLEWHGTEFICTKGHGLLHVPEIAKSSYGVQRWQALDPSWRTLF